MMHGTSSYSNTENPATTGANEQLIAADVRLTRTDQAQATHLHCYRSPALLYT